MIVKKKERYPNGTGEPIALTLTFKFVNDAYFIHPGKMVQVLFLR